MEYWNLANPTTWWCHHRHCQSRRDDLRTERIELLAPHECGHASIDTHERSQHCNITTTLLHSRTCKDQPQQADFRIQYPKQELLDHDQSKGWIRIEAMRNNRRPLQTPNSSSKTLIQPLLLPDICHLRRTQRKKSASFLWLEEIALVCFLSHCTTRRHSLQHMLQRCGWSRWEWEMMVMMMMMVMLIQPLLWMPSKCVIMNRSGSNDAFELNLWSNVLTTLFCFDCFVFFCSNSLLVWLDLGSLDSPSFFLICSCWLFVLCCLCCLFVFVLFVFICVCVVCVCLCCLFVCACLCCLICWWCCYCYEIYFNLVYLFVYLCYVVCLCLCCLLYLFVCVCLCCLCCLCLFVCSSQKSQTKTTISICNYSRISVICTWNTRLIHVMNR